MSLKSIDLTGGESTEQPNEISITSNHDLISEGTSTNLRRFQFLASANLPYDMRMKISGGKSFILRATKIVKVDEPYMWLIEGNVDSEPVEVSWSSLSLQGTMKYK